MAENLPPLQFSISSQTAQDDLKRLAAAFDKVAKSAQSSERALAQSANNINTSLARAATAMGKYGEVIDALNKIHVAASPAKAIMEMSAAMNELGRTRAISGAAVRNVKELAAIASGVRVSNSFSVLARDLNALSRFRAPSQASIRNLKEFLTVLAEAKNLNGAGAMARDLDLIAASASRTGTALATLPRRMQTFAGAQSAATQSLTRTRAGVLGLGTGLGSLGGHFNLAGQAAQLFMGAISAYGLSGFVRSVFDANTAVLKLQKAMLFSTGTFAGADDAIEQYEGIENRLGLSIANNIENYGKFSIAARTLGMDLNTSNKTWAGIERALGATGASSDVASRALYGVTMSLQKGKVQAQEFTREIGRTIPGAVVAGAEALSKLEHRAVSLGDFFKQMRQGTIASSTFMPEFAAQLEALYKPLQPLVDQRPDVALTRLGNAFTIFKQAVGDGAFMRNVGTALNDLTGKLVFTAKDGTVHLTASAQKLADEIGKELSAAIALGGRALQFLMDHIQGVTAAAKLFIEFEMAKTFLGWGDAALTAAGKLLKFATAQEAVNAARAASGVEGAAAGAAGIIPRFTRKASTALEEAAAINAFKSGNGPGQMESLGSKAAFTAESGAGAEVAAGTAGAALLRFAGVVGIAAIGVGALYDATKDISVGVNKYGDTVKVQDYLFGTVHAASNTLAESFKGLAGWLDHFMPAPAVKPKPLTKAESDEMFALGGDSSYAAAVRASGPNPLATWFKSQADAQAHRRVLATPPAPQIPKAAKDAQSAIEKFVQAELAN